MNLERVSTASLGILLLGASTTGATLVHAGGFSVLVTGFSVLALSPYAFLAGAPFLANSSRGAAIATLVVCALATACAIFFYGDLIFLHPGSMSGLVFFLVPFYQLPVAVLLLVVMFLSRLRSCKTA